MKAPNENITVARRLYEARGNPQGSGARGSRGCGIDFHRVGSAPVAVQPAARSSVETVKIAVSAAVMIRTGGACAAI